MSKGWTLDQLLAKLDELQARVDKAWAGWSLSASEDKQHVLAELEHEVYSVEMAVALIEHMRETSLHTQQLKTGHASAGG
jgi:hypothetical protein